ncbi:hypothetical protein [Acinetobacter sp. NigerLNRRAM0016]
MQRLPENGRVVLVDDKFEQAKPLINYLSKNKIPFTYFDGSFENLPESGFNDIRLLFLDINLSGDTVPSHQHFRALQTVVDKLINEITHPYLLILWTRDSSILEQFKQDFFNDSTLKKKRPIDILALEKGKFFSLYGDPLEGDSLELEKEFIEKLNEYPELGCIFHWESVVHKVTNEIASMFFPQFGEYTTWSDETKKMFTQFSKASLGKYFDDAKEETRLNSAFEVIHQVFMDELETQFYKAEKKLILDGLSDIIAPNYSINSKLLIEMNDRVGADYPGSLIELKKADTDKSNFLLSVIDKELFENKVGQVYELLAESGEKFSALSKSKRSEECKKYRKTEILPYLKIVQLRIDPLCDYVQKKIQHSKCVNGLLVPEIAFGFIDRRSEALYISPIFEYEGRNVALVIDYRTLNTVPALDQKSKDKNEIDEQSVLKNQETLVCKEELLLFRVRSGLLADIQSKFARHANRQGLLYL